MGSAGGCFGALEGLDMGGASSAISQLHCHQLSEESLLLQCGGWTDPEELP